MFGFWRLVIGPIIATGMNIQPKTKDHKLKTGIVFGLWQLVFGSIITTGMNILPKTKDLKLKTLIVFGFLLRIFYSHSHHTLTLAFLLRMSSAGGGDVAA